MPARHDYVLRPMVEADLPMVLSWRNQPRIREAMYTTHVISPAEHQAWWRVASVDTSKRLLILDYLGAPIGHVNFVQIHQVNGTANWGFYLGGSEAKRGAGAAMEYCALDHAFGELGLRKLQCEVFEFNRGVVRMHQKFGFVQEGVFSRQFLRDGHYIDVISMALFADHWRAIREPMAARVFRD